MEPLKRDAAELGAPFEPERNGHQTNGAGATLMGAEDYVPLSSDIGSDTGGAVHGRVRRSDGTGIAGATLTLIDSAGRQIGTATLPKGPVSALLASPTSGPAVRRPRWR